MPYGTRGPSAIIVYAKQDIAFLLSKNVKFLMAACGTVCSTLPADVTAGLPVPFAGVVDAARAARLATKTGRIGVIGTRHYPPAVTTAAAPPTGAVSLRQGLPHVRAAGGKRLFGSGDPVTRHRAGLSGGVRGDGVDTLILGCTHYPLIAPAIADLMGPGVTLIDGGGGRAAGPPPPFRAGPAGPRGQRGGAEYFVSDEPARL